MLDFNCSLGIHALQHFVNNCTKGIADAMPSFWDDVYPGMNALINCLSAKFFRQRFAATCLSSSEGAAWRPKFEEGYRDTLVGWRFGSLAACNQALLAYEYPLRQFWDDEKLHFKQHPQPEQPPPRPHSEKPEGPNISLASHACKSKVFWAWQHMFSRIANIVDHMTNWLQSCPCHELNAASWGARCHEFAQRLFLERQSRPAHCPMSGFRASEIACGQFESFITAITDMELAEVSVALAGCSPQERASVLADCQAARQHVVFAVQAELSCWGLTPRVFCGLSSYSEESARKAVLSGFRQWWAMSDADKARAHPLTKRFCEQGPLNSELLDFLNGQDRSELPLVMQEAGRLLLVPVNEISVERLHAQTRKELKRGPAAGAVAISWAQRSGKFLRDLASQPDVLKEVATGCADNYHPLRLMPTLGLGAHPNIVDAIAATTLETRTGTFELLGSTKDYDKISKQIVYHLDLQSQFLPSNPAFNKTSGRGSGAEGAVSLEDLRQQLLLEKFRQVHAPGTFYTIRKAYAADVLVADELPVFHVNSRPQESATDLMFQADGDAGVDVDSAVPGPVQNHAEVAPPAKDRDLFIAFQVLNIKPSAKKYALCDTGKELQVTDIAVSQHRVLNLDTVAKELEVSMEPGSDSKAWSRMLTARALSSCYAWSAKTGSLTAALQESLAADVASEELLQHIRRCVSMLYLARAVPNTTNYVPANTLQESFNDALDFLLSKGCVLRSDGLCQLTSRGLEALQLTQVLVEPTALLSLEADTPARKRSASALLHFLVEKGWSLQHVNPRRAVEPLGPFSEASPPSSKTIVIKETRKTIDREYMLALVLVEDSRHRKKLLDIGINSIEHLMPLPFYVALNNADEAALQAMLMEADAGDDEVDLAQRFQRVRQGWRRKAGYRLDTSFRWGCVSFKGTRRRLADGTWSLGYECDCPRRSHSKASASGGRTRCTWTIQYADEDERLVVIRKLKWWVAQAWSCNSKRAHQAFRNRIPDELPSMQQLDDNTPPEGRPLTEDEADQDAEVPPAKRARTNTGRGRGRAAAAAVKAKPKPKAKAQGRGRGRGRARIVPDAAEASASTDVPVPHDEAASDPESEPVSSRHSSRNDSGSGSSSSSSSSSSDSSASSSD